MSNEKNSISVIGAGSWGTALANLLAHKGHQVCLWSYEEPLAEQMRQQRENPLYLPGIQLAENLQFSSDLQQAVTDWPILLLVSPSQALRGLLRQMRPFLMPRSLLICASKGIENDSLMLMSDVVAAEVPATLKADFAMLSGPSFAKEVAQQMPTAVVAAADDLAIAQRVQALFNTDTFRVYSQRDPIGVELGGAMKNVIALAAGISDGLGFGHNTRAGLITRGLAEIARLGKAMGADPSTFAGLAGMGDLVLTCTGDLSRNRTVGLELGRGKPLQQILAEMTMVAEGVKTTLSAYQLAQQVGVEMPITEQTYQILYQGKDCRRAVTDLMMRQTGTETG